MNNYEKMGVLEVEDFFVRFNNYEVYEDHTFVITHINGYWYIHMVYKKTGNVTQYALSSDFSPERYIEDDTDFKEFLEETIPHDGFEILEDKEGMVLVHEKYGDDVSDIVHIIKDMGYIYNEINIEVYDTTDDDIPPDMEKCTLVYDLDTLRDFVESISGMITFARIDDSCKVGVDNIIVSSGRFFYSSDNQFLVFFEDIIKHVLRHVTRR